MTNEELDNARAEEAWVLYNSGEMRDVSAIAARLAREGWAPLEAVDPDREEARTLAIYFGEEFGNYTPARLALQAIKRGRELERYALQPKEGEEMSKIVTLTPETQDNWPNLSHRESNR